MMERESSLEKNLLQKSQNKEQMLENAILDLAEIITPAKVLHTSVDDAKALWHACQRVTDYQGITLPLIDEKLPVDNQDPIETIIGSARIRRRVVNLSGAWYKEDHGAILGFLKQKNSPVALIPTTDHHYNVFDPHTESTYRLTDPQSIEQSGYIFYRTLKDQALNFKDLLVFSQAGNKVEWFRVFRMIIFMGILSLSLPYGFGILTNIVLSGSMSNELIFFIILLLSGAIANTCCSLTRGLAILRLQGKTDNTLQTAIFDRLLKLPLPFFRDYQIGDLGMRAMGIEQILQAFTGRNLVSILSGILGIFYLIFIAIYSLPIAFMTLCLLILLFGITFFAGLKMLSYTRNEQRLSGSVTGQILQYINGIVKIRTTASEELAFANWATKYADKQKNLYKSQLILCRVEAFNQVFPFLATVSLFTIFALIFKNTMALNSSSIFLAINAAFGVLIGLTLNLSQTLLQMLRVVPIYERLKPILATLPEINEQKINPGKLRGGLEAQHVSFRYPQSASLTLDDITLEIKPGEYVAIVGASGSGKSTFLRLFLGFEAPSLGEIYYDNKELSGLDITAVRRQIGVVLQTSQLTSDSIFNNIIGSSLYTLDDAWDVLRLVGLADVVEALPMGIHTVISESGGVISGGEKQKILLARALIGRPKIIFLDEATSGLDNKSQSLITDTLQKLDATRVIIAHRLSTVQHVDRIFVLSNGKLVESGTYTELINKGMVFSDLAKRQLT